MPANYFFWGGGLGLLVWEEIENEQTVHKGLAKLLYRLQKCKNACRLNCNVLIVGGQHLAFIKDSRYSPTNIQYSYNILFSSQRSEKQRRNCAT
jgi:hypothetical protein